MTEQHFKFSVPEHVTYFAGYLDAVGRFLTTDAELWALTARTLEKGEQAASVLGAVEHERTAIENWSKEFGSLVDDFLAIDQSSRFGFYLVEYVCWFKQFTQNAECFRLDCELLRTGTLRQAVYLLALEGDRHVLLIFQRIDKAYIEPHQPDAGE